MTQIQDLIVEKDTQGLLKIFSVSSWSDDKWGNSTKSNFAGNVAELGESLGITIRNKTTGLSRFGDKCLNDIDFFWGRWYERETDIYDSVKPFLQRVLQVGQRDGTWVRINVDTHHSSDDFHKNIFTIRGQRFNLPKKATKIVSWRATFNQPLTDELRKEFPGIYNDNFEGETHNWEHIDFDSLSKRINVMDVLKGLEALGVLVREEHIGQKTFCKNYNSRGAYSNGRLVSSSKIYCYQEMWIDISKMDKEGGEGYGYNDLSFNHEPVMESWLNRRAGSTDVDILQCGSKWRSYSEGQKMDSPDRTYNKRTSPDDDYLYATHGYKEENWTRYGLERHYWTEEREKQRAIHRKHKSQEERLKDFRKDNLIVDEDILRWVKLKIDELLEMTEEDFHKATEDTHDNRYEIGFNILELIGDNGYKRRGTERFNDYRRQSKGYQMDILKDVLGVESDDWDYENKKEKEVK